MVSVALRFNVAWKKLNVVASDEKLSAEAAVEAAAAWSPVKALQRTAATITIHHMSDILYSAWLRYASEKLLRLR